MFFGQHSQWRALFEAQSALAAEKEAHEALLRVASDAACWIGSESGDILRSDVRLDELLGRGRSMIGQRLCDYMPNNESEQFLKVTGGTAWQCERKPVDQLPSTLISDGRELKVDLFIVDRRSAFSTTESRDPLGFLVGIRIVPEEQVLLPPDGKESKFEFDRLEDSTISSAVTGWSTWDLLGDDDLSETDVGKRSCSIRKMVSFSAPQVHNIESASVISDDCDCDTIPETLHSVLLQTVRTHYCHRDEMEEAIIGEGVPKTTFPLIACPKTRETLKAALNLIVDHARGGAFIVIAEKRAFYEAFNNELAPSTPSNSTGPTARSSDENYMTKRLRGIHISDARFAEAFGDFSLHTEADRWPLDHEDEAARGRPKDGAWLLSTTGYRVKCAAKLLGFSTVATMANVGTKHEAGLSTAWGVQNSFVLIRSDSGDICLIVRHQNELQVYQISC
jgi:hypothetical protein